MKSKLVIAAACVAVSVSACASAPEDVRPTFTSTTAYEGRSCEQLRGDLSRIGNDVDKVTGQQTAKRRTDQAAVGVGLILFAPAVLFMLTPDHKKELAKLKGEYEAVQRQGEAQHCKL